MHLINFKEQKVALLSGPDRSITNIEDQNEAIYKAVAAFFILGFVHTLC
jgi:hypothetical protein